MTPLLIIIAYLGILLLLGIFASRFFRGTGADYMLASHSIGPFLLLMSLFGTTMTAFALVGSTGAAWRDGIIIYGLMASSSGIVHSLCFFVLGVKLWSLGRRRGYTTQIQFFRDRLASPNIGLVLFPILVGLVIPYLLIGVMAAGTVVNVVTRGAFIEWGLWQSYHYGVPTWLGSLSISVVVLLYVFFGGMRATAWANTFQTMVFLVLGIVTFIIIADQLGGIGAATQAVEANQEHYAKLDTTRTEVGQLRFIAYLLIPASVGMFPHVFQHWLTAKRASAFKLPIVAHPLFILVVWAPCVLIGVWATSAQMNGQALVPDTANPNAVLILVVNKLTRPEMTGLLSAGILAAIMSSLDSQFLCLGSMFTKDIVQHHWRGREFTDKQIVWLARGFIVFIVTITYLLSLANPIAVFDLGIWCFSGFTGLVPLVFAALYWKRLTRFGAYASVVSVVATWSFLFLQSGFGKNHAYTFLDLMPVVLIFAVATVTLIVVSLATKPPDAETLDKFFANSSAGQDK